MDPWELHFAVCRLGLGYPELCALEHAMHRDENYTRRVKTQLRARGFCEPQNFLRRGWRGGEVWTRTQGETLELYEFRTRVIDKRVFQNKGLVTLAQVEFDCRTNVFLLNEWEYQDPLELIKDFLS